MGFGNIGIGELMMIFLIIMMVFGPKRLPGIARDMGKFLRDFRRETNAAIKELKDGIEPINVGIFDEPDASSTKVAGAGNGAAAPLPGVAAAGGAGVVPAPVDPPPSNGSRKSAARKKTSGARKPARASSSTARRKKPAQRAARTSSSSATLKKRPAQKATKGKSSSSARARTSRKR